MRKYCFIFILALVVMAGCKGRAGTSVSGTGLYFDTVVTFTVYGTDDRKIIDELMNECARYERIFSPTLKESELYKLNHGELSEVSYDLYSCIEMALYYCETLSGRYDISIRPVCELWDFTGESAEIPDAKDIEERLKYVDYRKVSLSDGSKVYLEDGVMLDLGSAAKGYISDKLCTFLKEKGFDSAVISLGGNVQCLGGKKVSDSKYEDFNIAIKAPSYSYEKGREEGGNSDPGSMYGEITGVRDMAVVTSGIYERCFEKDGTLYHHILDAKTGYPVENSLASVTIISSSGAAADILSTVCFIAGYEDTVKISDSLKKYGDFEAEFIFKDGRAERTDGFETYIIRENG